MFPGLFPFTMLFLTIIPTFVFPFFKLDSGVSFRETPYDPLSPFSVLL